ncbi:Acetyltransferase, fucose-4-O-acetylase [Methylocella tundrae]|uniref:Acetyltransferase, fucose-4-O-acetylase n=1 Tax=Methylocella tundrae TaxID=227605 RepID=A0A8B6M982_METTU|nr:acyltransferase [Methylocella tundrae]VTZ25407.1 Acetyltransferase, fucose-4-O-acetylase [Methylocella tundrae]VTZ51402.1 Acetyltransferase, fucose-4-O-acetylase [Methylocella tundrae]
MSISDQRRDWLDDIERLKGLMIILVVWGHCYDPNLPDWALGLRHAIYAFHMPVFMFLSGYVYIHVKAHLLRSSYGVYVLKRAKRLLVPFFAMAAIIIAGKIASQSFVVVNKPINDVAASVWHLFIHTEQSPVLFVWYLFVLFAISIMVPILSRGQRWGLAALGVASVLLHIAHVEMFYSGIVLDYLYLNRIIMYFVFFMYGALACEYRDRWINFVGKAWLAALVLFVLLQFAAWESEWRYLLVGCTAVVLFHGLMRSKAQEALGFLTFFGRNALVIYLLNLIFVGAVRGIYTKYLSPHDYAMGLLLSSTALGVFGPIIVKYAIFSVRPLRPLAVAME